ncbi:hypothetical protein BO85DRAFT_25658 [Aspergillus piperis CBS 112811]|uniref:Uncharacterized protein n=1 Tax=Aspergillus piperis CBS 112811 TaxID=1448313 RepID=A0A8G1RHQ5_9EURO|nr:hypothetical protein BO85DRAFT_25658 [Aspergillus piperis CBS 112811]RAH63535.1 hypothetical protein BO85DRAFT_25658 [Aspergillus piperis CBS 112811]
MLPRIHPYLGLLPMLRFNSMFRKLGELDEPKYEYWKHRISYKRHNNFYEYLSKSLVGSTYMLFLVLILLLQLLCVSILNIGITQLDIFADNSLSSHPSVLKKPGVLHFPIHHHPINFLDRITHQHGFLLTRWMRELHGTPCLLALESRYEKGMRGYTCHSRFLSEWAAAK